MRIIFYVRSIPDETVYFTKFFCLLIFTCVSCNKSNGSSSPDDTDSNEDTESKGDTESSLENQSFDSSNGTDLTPGDDSSAIDDTETDSSVDYSSCGSFTNGHSEFTGMELFDGYFGAVLNVQEALDASRERTDELVGSMAAIYEIAQGLNSAVIAISDSRDTQLNAIILLTEL